MPVYQIIGQTNYLRLTTLTTHLDDLVPATGDNDGVAAIWGEAHTRSPLSVAVIL